MSLEKRMGPSAIASELNRLDGLRAVGASVDPNIYNGLTDQLRNWPIDRSSTDYVGQHRQPTTDAQFWQNAAANVRRLPNFGRRAPAID